MDFDRKIDFFLMDFLTLESFEKTHRFFGCVCVEATGIAMPKNECSRLGHAPRKALRVKKASKKEKCTGVLGIAATKALAARKGPAKAKTQKEHAKAAASPQALEVVSADEHVSASPTPPTPSSPHSPRYERESWWDSFSALSRRIEDAAAGIEELKDRVKSLEAEREKNRAGSNVFGKSG